VKKNVVDSSGWLEYFTDSRNANFFAPAIEDNKNLIIPSVSLLEVFKHILRHSSEQKALEAIECMMQGTVINLDIEISLSAAKLGVQHKIPLTDSIILATGLMHEATIWSQDADFDGLPNVKYVKK
jgi:predicted nucleic acid-binding protein